jgi:hypothetical protein
MEIQATQLHQQIDQTRTAMTAELDLLKQYVLQKVPATVEQTVIAPVRSLQETTTKGTTLLHQYPWLIIAGGMLFGYYLRGAQTRPIRSVQSPPQRAMGASPTVPPAMARAMPQVYDSPRQPSTQAKAPPTLGEPTNATPPESRPSAWNLGGISAKELARRVIDEIQDDDC